MTTCLCKPTRKPICQDPWTAQNAQLILPTVASATVPLASSLVRFAHRSFDQSIALASAVAGLAHRGFGHGNYRFGLHTAASRSVLNIAASACAPWPRPRCTSRFGCRRFCTLRLRPRLRQRSVLHITASAAVPLASAYLRPQSVLPLPWLRPR